jgi:ADP-ribose pyrophosphatase YjhB (NUDIX family)
MSFLRLGVNCAVMDDEGRVLLSRRGDLNVWNLPGGRLDSGEALADAAAREVLEETGLVVYVERAIGLYYWSGWERLNVLYAGWPLAGELAQRTNETRANQFFSPDKLPAMLWSVMPFDAVAETRHKPRLIEMSPRDLRLTKLKLRWRWLKNLVSGRPEPRFPRFDVQAVGIIWEDTYRRVLTLPDSRGHTLPRVACTGQDAPWDELAEVVEATCGVQPSFRWVGLWQDISRDRVEFVFASTIEEMPLSGSAEWSTMRNTALTDRDAEYVGRVKPGYMREQVWMIGYDPDVKHGEIIAMGEVKRHDSH